MSNSPTNEHKEQARAMIALWINKLDKVDSRLPPLLIDAITAALSSRDTEIRELLSGFIHAGVEFDDERMSYVVMQIDRRDLELARALYAKLQRGEESLTR